MGFRFTDIGLNFSMSKKISFFILKMSFVVKDGLREVTIKKVTWIGSGWIRTMMGGSCILPKFQGQNFKKAGEGEKGGGGSLLLKKAWGLCT